jgi:hypothetical protein
MPGTAMYNIRMYHNPRKGTVFMIGFPRYTSAIVGCNHLPVIDKNTHTTSLIMCCANLTTKGAIPNYAANPLLVTASVLAKP